MGRKRKRRLERRVNRIRRKSKSDLVYAEVLAQIGK